MKEGEEHLAYTQFSNSEIVFCGSHRNVTEKKKKKKPAAPLPFCSHKTPNLLLPALEWIVDARKVHCRGTN